MEQPITEAHDHKASGSLTPPRNYDNTGTVSYGETGIHECHARLIVTSSYHRLASRHTNHEQHEELGYLQPDQVLVCHI
jgi:hypothetical protein